MNWLTHIIAFVIGTGTGAIGQYLAHLWTDRRRRTEEESGEAQSFRDVSDLMPDLIKEMSVDVNKPETATIREFAVLPSMNIVFNTLQPRFVYSEEEHDNLRGKVGILENHGYVSDITPGNVPIYRMSEEFVRLLRAAQR